MKAIVLVLCLLIPVSAWAQKEEVVDPQQLKMMKGAIKAANKAKPMASGIQKSHADDSTGGMDGDDGPRVQGGDKAPSAAQEQAE